MERDTSQEPITGQGKEDATSACSEVLGAGAGVGMTPARLLEKHGAYLRKLWLGACGDAEEPGMLANWLKAAFLYGYTAGWGAGLLNRRRSGR